MSRRGITSLSGILLVDKPAGMTSHDVVAAVRRATGEGRVGHAGTLDPMATGLLVVLVGPYARLAPYLSAAEKSYEARIAFGTETDTDDAEGTTTRSADTPAELFDAAHAQGLIHASLGASLQTPPAYSAIKVGGRVSHRAARAGEELVLADRPIEVFEAELTAIDADARTWDVRYRVSKGTYVRALARDLGRAAGSAAHLSALRRTASGNLSLDTAHDLEDVALAAREDRIAGLFADPITALDLPVLDFSPKEIAHGHSPVLPPGSALTEGAHVAVRCEGVLAGVYSVRADRLAPDVVLPTREVA